MATKGSYFYGLGRRKSAIASARLYEGKGEVTINGKKAADFLSGNATLLAELTDPIALVGKQNDFDISLHTNGGGVSGEAESAQE